MGKQSKRQRKDKDARSLRQKAGGGGGGDAGLDLLSEELKEQLLSSGGGADALVVLPGSKAQKDASKQGNSDGVEAEQPLSKSQLRKLKQIQQKKERRENLSQVLTVLEGSRVSDEALAAMRPLHQRGARETKKQRLRRALRLERAGVALDAEAAEELHPSGRPRKRRGGAGVEDEDGSDSEGSEGNESEEEAEGVGQPVGGVKATGARPGSAKGGDSSDEDEEGSSEDEDEAAAAPGPARGAHAKGGPQQAGQLIQGKKGQAAAAAVALNPAAAKLSEAQRVREEVRRARQEAGVTVEGDGSDEEGGPKLTVAGPAMPSATPAGGKHRVVTITRPADIDQARQGLPIIGMEQEIMEAIAAHDVLVLCGETGCGKTTQVPQFLLEAGYGCPSFPERAGRVGVTQPRRVAATSTAARVAAELGEELGGCVGYQVRYDRVVGSATRLKFMTDGVLLRELQEDFTLAKYSALVVDEAHERSLNTDLVLGMLSRVVPMRRKLWLQQRAAPGYDPTAPDSIFPLKLIIMSATLRTSDFVANARLFPKPPPVVQVPARQYPVTVHFARRTELHDYVDAAFRKVTRIHRELPPGGVLVFVTGQREVEHLVKKLRAVNKGKKGEGVGAGAAEAEPSTQGGAGGEHRVSRLLAAGAEAEKQDGGEDGEGVADAYGEDGVEVWGQPGSKGPEEDEEEEEEGADDYDELNDSGDEDEEEVEVMGGDGLTPEEIAEAERRFEEALAAATGQAPFSSVSALSNSTKASNMPPSLHVLPLYAMLPAEQQAQVFEPPPPGTRLVVVATNVAETSLTIPGIRYVVDAGRSKQRLLDHEGGSAARFEVRWVSQASAAQRAGRAGRTGPGHCYRLYSSAHYAHTMPQHAPPEIVNTSLEGVVLVMKAMGVDKVGNFPFPTPPEAAALRSAEACLVALGALDGRGALTDVGRAMAAFPIGPRHARMMLEVAAWQLRMGGAGPGASGVPPSFALASEALPLAVALAAVLTVDSPFVHIDGMKGRDKEVEAKMKKAGDEVEEGGRKPAMSAAEREEADALERQQQRARAAHLSLRVGDSDALSCLSALCSYLAAGEEDTFCTSHFLHARNLREAADLTRQLARCIANAPASHAQQVPANSAAASLTHAAGNLAAQLAAVAGDGKGSGLLRALKARPGGRLSTSVCDLLRRALAVGWADQVARRVRSAEHVRRALAAPGGKRHAVRYASCALANAGSMSADAVAAKAAVRSAEAAGVEEDVGGDVYLHPRSALHSTAPDYVVYNSLVRTDKRPYMAGVTAVQPEWLASCGTPLASFSAPLLDPAPAYAPPPTDSVMAWHDVTYGRHMWPLPRCLRPHPDPATCAAVFGAALLEGRVVAGLADFKPLMITAPGMAARPEMRGVARVGELVTALTSKCVSSAASLCTQWETNPSYLRAEVAAWLPRTQHSRLGEAWPRLVAGALSQRHQAAAAAVEAAAKQERKVLKRATELEAAAAGDEDDMEEDEKDWHQRQGKGAPRRKDKGSSIASKAHGHHKGSVGKQQQVSQQGYAGKGHKKRAQAGGTAAGASLHSKKPRA